MPRFQIYPVGYVRIEDSAATIEILAEFEPALLGLADYSHIHVLYWFDRNDTPEKRQTLRVHPRGNPDNPLTGVFATHSPVRPNLIALTRCRIRKIMGRTIQLDKIDALDGSPVIDIKGHIPGAVSDGKYQLPDWV